MTSEDGAIIRFNADETFRNEYRHRNSDAAILRFPFPFDEDSYMFKMNLEPHVRGAPDSAFAATFDVDEHYIAECRERALVLAEDPGRCEVMPHLDAAQWDVVELVIEVLSNDYPDLFTLVRDGRDWTWTNRALGIEDHFAFGDADSLPHPPFEYITRRRRVISRCRICRTASSASAAAW